MVFEINTSLQEHAGSEVSPCSTLVAVCDVEVFLFGGDLWLAVVSHGMISQRPLESPCPPDIASSIKTYYSVTYY